MVDLFSGSRRCMTAAFAVVFALASQSHAARPANFQVHFKNSCASEVQPTFNQAVTLLHSFEYHEASMLFNEAIARDPDCAMARWGLAMSLWHPLWARPSEADLEKGARILDDARNLAKTPKETAYIEALSSFFSETKTSPHGQRAKAYEEKMSAVYAQNLDDPEAALFYALSLLATADPRDKSYSQQFKAAGLLNWVGESNPRHPGVLHYLIHSYDYPGLAHLALPAALAYADAAPASAHAQHMPSHIFTRLGMWERALASNQDATRSAAEYTKRAHLTGHYDEGLHSIDYLMYAMLQTARDDEAGMLLAELRKIEKANDDNFKTAFTYASSPARYALERRQWNEASQLVLAPADFPWRRFPWAESIHHFARGLGSARSGDLAEASSELEIIKGLQEKLAGDTLPYWREQVQVHIEIVHSWIVFGQGDVDEALSLALAAADREDAVDKHPVTPGEVLPARELYADMLLSAERPADALTQYAAVLKRSPNRLNALVGAARAAHQADDVESAAKYLTFAEDQTRFGDRRRIGLRE